MPQPASQIDHRTAPILTEIASGAVMAASSQLPSPSGDVEIGKPDRETPGISPERLATSPIFQVPTIRKHGINHPMRVGFDRSRSAFPKRRVSDPILSTGSSRTAAPPSLALTAPLDRMTFTNYWRFRAGG